MPYAAAGPRPGDAYRPFARAFDAAAPTYDTDFGPANAIMTAFRTRSLAVLEATLPRAGWLLELGCGTGVEAAALARSAPARRILATDLSPAMLEQARQRAEAEGVGERLAFRQLAAGDVRELADGERGFAGAYSSFGPLNCEPDVRRVAAGLALVLPSGAPFVLSVINKWCVWELAWYAAHGDLARARRRLAPSIPGPSSHEGRKGAGGDGRTQRSPLPSAPRSDTSVDGSGPDGDLRVPPPLSPLVGERGRGREGEGGSGGLGLSALPISYLTPADLRRAFAPWFAVVQQEGMGVALPPPSLAPWLARRPRLAALLTAAETQLRAFPAAAWLGDHFLMALRRTDAPAEAA